MFILACSEREIILDKVSDIPQASFNVTNDSCHAPCQIILSNTSSHGNSYVWDFGNGKTDTTENPSHIYDDPGNYTISLTVFGIDNVSSDTSISITILPPDSSGQLFAEFILLSDQANGVIPDTLCLINTSQNATSFIWDFGDENTSTSAEDTVCHIFSNPGQTIIKLIANNGIETDSFSVELLLSNPIPIANFESENDSCTAPCTIQFTNTSLYSSSYEWNFGDGGTSSDVSPSYTYVAAGTYEATLLSSNDEGSDQVSKQITILEKKDPCNIPSLFSIEPDVDQFGTPVSIQFNSNVASNEFDYSWDFGDGTSSSELAPLHDYIAVSETQKIGVTLSIQKDTTICSQTDSITLYNGPLPGQTRLTYIDVEQRIVHVSPISTDRDSQLVCLPAFQGLGEILDMKVDYTNRKVFALIGEGIIPQKGGRDPEIWVTNLNGTQTKRLYQSFNTRISGISYVEKSELLYWMETDEVNIGEYTLYVARADGTLVTDVTKITEDAFMSVDQIEVNDNLDEVYYYMESEGFSFIRGVNISTKTPLFFIEGDFDQEFAGLTLDRSVNELYVYYDEVSAIRKYDISNEVAFEVILNTNQSVEKIAIDKARNQLFWIEVTALGSFIEKGAFNGTQTERYINNRVDRHSLQLGRFK